MDKSMLAVDIPVATTACGTCLGTVRVSFGSTPQSVADDIANKFRRTGLLDSGVYLATTSAALAPVEEVTSYEVIARIKLLEGVRESPAMDGVWVLLSMEGVRREAAVFMLRLYTVRDVLVLFKDATVARATPEEMAAVIYKRPGHLDPNSVYPIHREGAWIYASATEGFTVRSQ